LKLHPIIRHLRGRLFSPDSAKLRVHFLLVFDLYFRRHPVF
jgi:hypothetical protein